MEQTEVQPKEQEKIRFIDLDEVMDMVGLSRSTVYEKIKEGVFPAPVKQGYLSRWVESEVREYQQTIIDARNSVKEAA